MSVAYHRAWHPVCRQYVAAVIVTVGRLSLFLLGQMHVLTTYGHLFIQTLFIYHLSYDTRGNKTSESFNSVVRESRANGHHLRAI